MKKLLLGMTLLTQLSFGAIHDPGNIRGQVSAIFSGQVYEKAFTVGDHYTRVSRNSCTIYQNRTICNVEEERREVTDVQPTMVTYNDKGVLPRAFFDQFNGNPFELFLTFLEGSNQSFEISQLKSLVNDSTEISLKKFVKLPSIMSSEIYEVQLTIMPESGTKLPLYVQLATGLPWNAQILTLGLGESLSSSNLPPMYEVTGWSKL